MGGKKAKTKLGRKCECGKLVGDGHFTVTNTADSKEVMIAFVDQAGKEFDTLSLLFLPPCKLGRPKIPPIWF